MIKLSVKSGGMRNSGLLKPKNNLNPMIWSGMEIDPEVQSQLNAIANDILKNIEITAEIKDIVITGSTASYNWHKMSDIDLHILLDFKEIDENFELVKRMLDQTRINWNKTHNIFIRGHEVELYFQDINEPHKANGIWSISKDEWIKEPVKQDVDLDLDTAEKKAEMIVKSIEHAVEAFERGDNIDAYEYASKIKKKIANMRKSGLDREGIYSPENLAFKMLRNAHHLEKLSDIKITSYDRMMSIQEMYIKDYFNSNKDKEHMEFEGKYDLEELLDPNGPAPWGEVEKEGISENKNYLLEKGFAGRHKKKKNQYKLRTTRMKKKLLKNKPKAKFMEKYVKPILKKFPGTAAIYKIIQGGALIFSAYEALSLKAEELGFKNKDSEGPPWGVHISRAFRRDPHTMILALLQWGISDATLSAVVGYDEIKHIIKAEIEALNDMTLDHYMDYIIGVPAPNSTASLVFP